MGRNKKVWLLIVAVVFLISCAHTTAKEGESPKKQGTVKKKTQQAKVRKDLTAEEELKQGNHHLARGEDMVAIAHYQNALKKDPSLATAHLQMAKAYGKQRRMPLYEEALQEAIKIDPTLEEAHYILASWYFTSGRNKEALTEAEIQANYGLGAGTYYWKASADDGGDSTTSETRSFTILGLGPDSLPPGVTLNAPADGAQIPEGDSVVLDVTVSDPEGSPLEVWIYGDTSSVPTTLLHYETGVSSPADILYTWGGDESEFAVTGNTVGEALGEVFRQNPRLRHYVLDDRGRLRRHIVVFVNGALIEDRQRLSDPLEPACELFVAQAVS